METYNAAPRLAQQFRFIVEADKVKQVFRRNRVMDGTRYENDAEHSWTLTLTAMTLAEYAVDPIDTLRVIKMLIIHDIVEIDAGDTFPYGNDAVATQHDREAMAADRIFNILPPDLAAEYRALWDEFETRETAEARFATAIDHLGGGVIPNYQNNGGGWRENGVSLEQVLERNQRIAKGSPILWDFARDLIDELASKGLIESSNGTRHA